MFNSLKVLEAEAGMVLESPLYTCDETELSLNIQEGLLLFLQVVSRNLLKKKGWRQLKSKKAEYIFFFKKTKDAKIKKKMINCDLIYLFKNNINPMIRASRVAHSSIVALLSDKLN